MLRVKLEAAVEQAAHKVTKGKDKVTDAQITAYYNKNKSRFAQPERRDLQHRADQDEGQGRRGQAGARVRRAFKTVAKKYSIDRHSKAQGGKLPAVAKGQQEKAFDDAVFRAPKGKLIGPIKTQFGYYVFKVDKVTKASQQTLTQANADDQAAARRRRTSRRRSTRSSRTSEKWKDKTDCREGYVTQDCKNGPKPTPTPTVGARRRRRRPTATPAQSTAGEPAGEHRPSDVRGGSGRARRAHPPPAASSARGTASRTSARSSRTPSRRPTSWPRRPTRGDDGKLLDELGDVLFQVHFLSLLLEERGAGSLAEVAEHCRQKLIRRHPHVFGEVEVEHAGEVLRNWDAIKQTEAGPRAGDLRRGAGEPARRRCTRARCSAARRRRASTSTTSPTRRCAGELEELEAADARGALPRGRRRAVRRGQRRPQAQGRPGAGAARGGGSLPRRASRRPRAWPHRTARDWNDLDPDEQLALLRAGAAERGDADLEPDRERPRPPDPRLARQPDRRGRARAALRRAGPRRGARPARRPASSRRPSCATAASAYLGKGVTQAVGQRQRRDRARRSPAATCSTRRGSTAR